MNLLPASSDTLQQLRQLHQIRSAEKRSTRGDLHKRIDTCHIGAARWNRPHLSFRVEEIHAIIAPVVAVFDQFELLPEQWMERMGYTKMFLRTVIMRCS